MFLYKGIGIVFLKKIVQKAVQEKTLLSLLNADEQLIYQRTLEVSWVPMEATDKLFTEISRLCHPGLAQDDQLYRLGAELAQSSMNKMYQLVFKLVSPQMVLKKAANLWRTYHNGGQGAVIQHSGNSAVFEVTGYPDLPVNFAQAMSGYIHGLLELTGARDCHITKSKTVDGWIWTATWRE